jgi:hypothetical protein
VTDLPSHFAVAFRTQIRRRLKGKLIAEPTTGPPCEQECVMSIEHPPHDKPARRNAFRNVEHAGNVVPLREGNDVRQAIEAPPVEAPHQGDELLTALSPLLDEVDGLRGDETMHQNTNNVVLLLEENARLRKLAVKLSNLLGDLPAQST